MMEKQTPQLYESTKAKSISSHMLNHLSSHHSINRNFDRSVYFEYIYCV